MCTGGCVGVVTERVIEPRTLRARLLELRRLLGAVAGVMLATAIPAGAQQFTRDNYYTALPPTPPIISQSEATERFHLYGDRTAAGFRDMAPRDGIDDRAAMRLADLAEHFSPILRRNTLMVPREVEDVLSEPVQIRLDVWREQVRVDSAVIDLGPRVSSAYSGSDGAGLSAVAPGDALLLDVLRALSPRRMRPPITPAAPPSDTILFIDIPGEDDFSWRTHHGRRLSGQSKIYAHPFVHEVAGVETGKRYELLIQYWFYYPYNDAANNHEGDWEHITVSITTAERALEPAATPAERGLLTASDVAALIDPISPPPLDDLRIRYVAYYFHNNVMLVDYLKVAAGETLWRRVNGDGSIHIWEDTGYMDEAVRRRLTEANGRLATHPIGYIGGNSKGTDELLQLWPRFLGSYNRDSHGTYPFPGVWRKVGPLDATEKIYGDVVPRLKRDGRGEVDASLPWHAVIDDERYLVYRSEDIILLPDWERVEPLMLEDPLVRREWAWFLLPVHLGFPASASPGAGTLKRVDLGNVAPMSPAYNSAWNRPVVTSVYPLYEPTVLRVALAPISPLASLQSGWGVFNLPLVVWGLLPGGNVLVTQLLPWVTGGMHVLGSPPAKTFYLGELPERITSFSGGGFRQFGGDDFARLLPTTDNPAVREYLDTAVPAGSAAGPGRREAEFGSRVWFNLHYSSRLSIENSFGYGETAVSYPIRSPQGQSLTEVSGTLVTREVTGGITYRLPPLDSDFLRLYARTGYAWTSYTLSQVAVGGRPIEGAGLRGGRLPVFLPTRAWWPNTGYAGFGAEVFTPPRHWFLKRVGYGMRVEATGLLHRLAAPNACDDCRVTAERGDVAVMFLFGW